MSDAERALQRYSTNIGRIANGRLPISYRRASWRWQRSRLASYDPTHWAPYHKLHPFARGLIATLPKVGTPWSDDAKKAWLDAATSCLALMYPAPPSDKP